MEINLSKTDLKNVYLMLKAYRDSDPINFLEKEAKSYEAFYMELKKVLPQEELLKLIKSEVVI